MEAVAIIYGRDDGGFDQGGSSNVVANGSDSGYVLHIDPRRFAFGLKFPCGRENVSKVFGLSTGKNEVDIHRDMKDYRNRGNWETTFRYIRFAIYVIIRIKMVNRQMQVLTWSLGEAQYGNTDLAIIRRKMLFKAKKLLLYQITKEVSVFRK